MKKTVAAVAILMMTGCSTFDHSGAKICDGIKQVDRESKLTQAKETDAVENAKQRGKTILLYRKLISL